MNNVNAIIIVLLLAAMWWDLRNEQRATKGIVMPDRTLDDLKASIGQVDNLVGSVSTFISGLQGRLNAIPDLSPAAQAKVNAMFDEVNQDVAGFTAALAQGTPAESVVASHIADAPPITGSGTAADTVTGSTSAVATNPPADTTGGAASSDATESGTFSNTSVPGDQSAPPVQEA